MRGLPSVIVVGDSATAEGRGKVDQCYVGLRARLEAGHGVCRGRPWQRSVFPLPSLKYLGAAGADPGEAQGYGLAISFLQECSVTWFVPHVCV